MIDTYGGGSLSGFRRALALKGTYVLVGGASGRWLGMSRLVKTLATSPFVSQSLRAFISIANPEDLIVLQELAEAGQITPVIDETYPLSETPDAMARVGEGHAQGKTVINIVAE